MSGVCPRQAALDALAPQVAERLARLVQATDPVEVDLAVLSLRAALEKVEASAPEAPGGALAPLLWQMRILDRDAGAWLLAGLPRLARWAARIAGPDTPDTCPPAARWLAGLRRRGALIALPQPAMIRRLRASAGALA